MKIINGNEERDKIKIKKNLVPYKNGPSYTGQQAEGRGTPQVGHVRFYLKHRAG